MQVRSKLALRVAVVGLSFGAVAVPLSIVGTSFSAAADTAPSLTVTPDTNVQSGSKVTVTGSNFPANKTAEVGECAKPTQSGCDGNTFQAPTTSADGSFTVKVPVHTGKVGSYTVKPGGKALITATTDLTGKVPNSSAEKSFTFAKNQSSAATKITAKAKSHGKTVKVKGTIKAGGAGTKGLKLVAYERKAGKKWKKAGSATSHKGGKFSVTGLKHFSHAEQYLVKHAKETVGGTTYGASKSKVSTVK